MALALCCALVFFLHAGLGEMMRSVMPNFVIVFIIVFAFRELFWGKKSNGKTKKKTSNPNASPGKLTNARLTI